MADPVDRNGDPEQPSAGIIPVAVVIYGLLMVAGYWWLWLRDRTAEIPAAAGGTWGISTSMAIGLAVGGALCALFAVLVSYSPTFARLQKRLADLLGPMTDNQITVMAFLSGLGEEFFFRLAMQDAIGLYWTAAVFTLLHLGPKGTLLWTAVVLGLGLGFGWMMEAGCGLLSVTVAHTLVNFVSLRRMNPR